MHFDTFSLYFWTLRADISAPVNPRGLISTLFESEEPSDSKEADFNPSTPEGWKLKFGRENKKYRSACQPLPKTDSKIEISENNSARNENGRTKLDADLLVGHHVCLSSRNGFLRCTSRLTTMCSCTTTFCLSVKLLSFWLQVQSQGLGLLFHVVFINQSLQNSVVYMHK